MGSSCLQSYRKNPDGFICFSGFVSFFFFSFFNVASDFTVLVGGGAADLREGQWATQPIPNLCQGITMDPAAVSTKFCWVCWETVSRVSI